MNYEKFFSDKLQSLKAEGRYRVFADLERLTGQAPYALYHNSQNQSRKVIVWCSNDYLNMSHHPSVIKAMTQTIDRLGAGSGGTRNISGTCHSHVMLERSVADLHGKESGLVFSSGYTANEAAICSLAEAIPECVVFSDEKNHASMIEGIRHSRAERRIFRHNNLDDLKRQLTEIGVERPKIITFVSVYSMNGDIAPIAEICDLAKQFNALTYLDEVHAVGIYGPQGAGVASHLGIQNRVDIIQGNFAKAYGVIGGYVTGSKTFVDYIRSSASGFIFTTSLPPAIAVGARTSIEILKTEDHLRQKLWQNVNILKKNLEKSSLPYTPVNSHIIPLPVGDAVLCRQVCDMLLHGYDIYIQPINYPTVPRGQERLRITVTPAHTVSMIEDLVVSLERVWKELDLRQVA